MLLAILWQVPSFFFSWLRCFGTRTLPSVYTATLPDWPIKQEMELCLLIFLFICHCVSTLWVTGTVRVFKIILTQIFRGGLLFFLIFTSFALKTASAAHRIKHVTHNTFFKKKQKTERKQGKRLKSQTLTFHICIMYKLSELNSNVSWLPDLKKKKSCSCYSYVHLF